MSPEDALRVLWAHATSATLATTHDPESQAVTLIVSWPAANVPEALRALVPGEDLVEAVVVPDAVVDEAGGLAVVERPDGMYVRTALARMAQRLTAPRPVGRCPRHGGAHIDVLPSGPARADDCAHVSARLDELAAIEHGWLDGEDAPPAPETVATMRDFLLRLLVVCPDVPRPHCYPLADAGGLQVEWTAGRWCVSLELRNGAGAAAAEAVTSATDGPWSVLAVDLRNLFDQPALPGCGAERVGAVTVFAGWFRALDRGWNPDEAARAPERCSEAAP